MTQRYYVVLDIDSDPDSPPLDTIDVACWIDVALANCERRAESVVYWTLGDMTQDHDEHEGPFA